MPETPFLTQPLDPSDVHRLADGTPLAQEAIANAEPVADEAAARQRLLISGLSWGMFFQGIEVVIGFAAMLILVRVIAPSDYGRAAATTGVLGILAIFNAHLFIGHALQLPDNETPDWSLHWSAAFYLQLTLFLACHAIAAICWLVPAYMTVAKLLHVAAFGVLFDAGSQVGATMLRRELRFRRLKLVGAIGIFFRIAIIIILALSGARAYAIVVGNNVVSSLPYAIDLFLVRRWRPAPGWWRLSRLRAYKEAARFGGQRIAGGLVGGIRDAADAVILPAAIGFTGIGLVNRAQALYGTTFGRVGAVFADTVYPFLPRERNHPDRYASYAALYLEMTFLFAIPGALFVGQQGQLMSRVLYGSKWIAADALMFPGAVIGLAGAVYTAAAGVLLAAGFVRLCLMLEAIEVVSALPGWWIAWSGLGLATYTWVLAGAQLLVAVVALLYSGRLLKTGWLRMAVLPPFVAGGVAAAAVAATVPFVVAWHPLYQLAAATVLFWAVVLLVMRACFANVLDTALGHVPGGDRFRLWLALRSAGENDVVIPPLIPDTGK